MREIVEEIADASSPHYEEAISYLKDLSSMEKDVCLRAFNNALNIGVSTFPYGDRLAEEIIYNNILNKVKIMTTLMPITAYAGIAGRDLVIGISPYSLYESAVKSMSEYTGTREIDETQLTTFYRAILKHELLHIMLKHLLRSPGRGDLELANMAMDALINNMISEFKALKVSLVTPEDIIQGKVGEGESFIIASRYALQNNFTWEQYYDYLAKMIKDKKPKLSFGGTQEEMANGLAPSTGDAQEGSGGMSGTQRDYNTQGDINPQPATELPDDIVNQICDIFKEVQERTRGLDRFRNLENLAVDHNKKPHRSWRQVLRKIFNGNSIIEKHYSMKRVDKRTDLPPGKKYTYRGGLIYVFVDTSGSINDKEIQDFASELYAITKKYKYRYRVFNFSVGVTNEVDLRQLRQGTYNVVERGGTSLLEALRTVLKDNKVPDMFIIFTDLYDDVPDPNEFHNRDVIYALTSNFNNGTIQYVTKYKYRYFCLGDQ